jgi:hypothetical protein
MKVSHKSMEIFVGKKENVILSNPHSPEINAGQVFSADSYKRIEEGLSTSSK